MNINGKIISLSNYNNNENKIKTFGKEDNMENRNLDNINICKNNVSVVYINSQLQSMFFINYLYIHIFNYRLRVFVSF